MKKFQTLAVYASAALMALSLAACSSDDEAPFNPVPSPTTPPSGPTEFVPEANAQQAAKYNTTTTANTPSRPTAPLCWTAWSWP